MSVMFAYGLNILDVLLKFTFSRSFKMVKFENLVGKKEGIGFKLVKIQIKNRKFSKVKVDTSQNVDDGFSNPKGMIVIDEKFFFE